MIEITEDGSPSVRPKMSSVRGVIERGSFYLPAFGEAPIDDVWAGLIDMTPDGLPVIEAAPEIEGLVIAAGFSGHGFCLGPVTGHLYARPSPGKIAQPVARAFFARTLSISRPRADRA